MNAWHLITAGAVVALLAKASSAAARTQRPVRGRIVIGGRWYSTPFPVIDRRGRLYFEVRTKPVTEGVGHHTVTGSWQATERVLLEAGYSTHFEVTPDGTAVQYGDPGLQVALHAMNDNPHSVAVDLTGPDPDRGFSVAQLDAFADLAKILSGALRFPLRTVPWAQVGVQPGTPGWYAHAQVQWEPGVTKIDPSWPYGTAAIWDSQIRPRLAA